MDKGRLEAFSDGVIAIIITIMVLDLKAPHGTDLGSLVALFPGFLTYALSFVFVGIYWINHHHLFRTAQHVDGLVLWANLHLLFWLSLVPLVTRWMSETHFPTGPVALYGANLLMAALAYCILTIILVRRHGKDSAFRQAVGRGYKPAASIVICAAAIALSFWSVPVACGLYVLLAIIWFVPDPRTDRKLGRHAPHGPGSCHS
jgi:uncharacterized membrane protein